MPGASTAKNGPAKAETGEDAEVAPQPALMDPKEPTTSAAKPARIENKIPTLTE